MKDHAPRKFGHCYKICGLRHFCATDQRSLKIDGSCYGNNKHRKFKMWLVEAEATGVSA